PMALPTQQEEHDMNDLSSMSLSSTNHRASAAAKRAIEPERQADQLSPPGARRMDMITAKDGTQIYYKDWGKGPVITFSHGWPLNADAWDGQMLFLAQ